MDKGYKIQEFVAHSCGVNCLKIGKRSRRMIVSGGNDCKVNIWAIGKPNFVLSLPGHASPIESVAFDSQEVLVLSGASTGAIKLLDLEEAKVVRTLTGHRSNCLSVEFHPFGEFFASGSSDSNLKIWDIRKKGCIHTYKGHNRGINTINFTPDGRWIVSGGEDNVVKLWDLTAGKLLHNFKFHEGQIRCIDFHPHEFLMATGSVDKTVKFWDLETFELIGTAGSENAGVRSMVFHPDGRTLFCGLDDSLKVFSWEPVICHGTIDMGWSTLGDLTIHENKLLGCSYHLNSVRVWAMDSSLLVPASIVHRFSEQDHVQGSYDCIENKHIHCLNGSLLQKMLPQNVNSGVCESEKNLKILSTNSTESKHSIRKRVGLLKTANTSQMSTLANRNLSSSNNPLIESQKVTQVTTNPLIVPVVVPRNNHKVEVGTRKGPFSIERSHTVVSRSKPSHSRSLSDIGFKTKRDVTETCIANNNGIDSQLDETNLFSSIAFEDKMIDKPFRTLSPSNETHLLKKSVLRDDRDKQLIPSKSKALDDADGPDCGAVRDISFQCKPLDNCTSHGANTRSVTEKFERIFSSGMDQSSFQECDKKSLSGSRGLNSVKYVGGVAVVSGKTRSLVERFERKEISLSSVPLTPNSPDILPENEMQPVPSRNLNFQKEQVDTSRSNIIFDDTDVVEDILRSHDKLVTTLQSRLAKLQVVRNFWERGDIKGSISIIGKLPDHSVQADVISVFLDRIDIVTLDLFSCLLPLLSSLLNSEIDRHVSISLETLLKLVRIFGHVIHSTVSSATFIGVDLMAEQRRSCCNECLMQLNKVKQVLPSLTRRGGSIAKSAQGLVLAMEAP